MIRYFGTDAATERFLKGPKPRRFPRLGNFIDSVLLALVVLLSLGLVWIVSSYVIHLRR